MGFTTPSAPFDVAAVFPELAGQHRTTVRLHPRRGRPAITDSSVGGPLLWPADEPWPICPEPQTHDPSEGWDPLPLVPVMQLFARDVPELPFPDDADSLQVLWCPLDHEPYCQPHTIDPAGWRLPAELRERIWAWEDEFPNPDDWSYFPHLSSAPGSKVGGWVRWIQDPEQVKCSEGHEMAHLLTIASREFDIESGKRWAPIEERSLLAPHTPLEIQEPTDLMIQDAGSLYLFVCLECPERPVDSLSQGS